MAPSRKLNSTFLEKKTPSDLSAVLLEQLTGGIFLYSLSTRKLLFHNEEFETLTGLSRPKLNKNGLEPFFGLIVEEDFEMIMSQIYPFTRELLFNWQDQDLSVFKCTLNYRIKMQSGKLKHLFHQSTILEHSGDNEPEITLTHISDISEYKKDSAMLLRLSAYDSEKKKWRKLADEKFKHKPKNLSAREVNIMQLIVSGQSQHDIAKKLHISYFTVRAHCRHILEKTNCRSIKDLKLKSIEEGWV